MKKKLSIVLLIIIILVAYLVYWAFFDMNRLPEGELISQVQSPNGTYTLKAYRTNGGATVWYAIRGELNFNNSIRRAKDIYWNYPEDEAEIKWLDDDTVIINGIQLDVPNEKFDFRRKK